MNLKRIMKKNIMSVFCLVFREGFRPAALMYHSVNPSPHQQSIRPDIFERQIKYLADNNFVFLKASELADANRPENKYVCLTFDDGFEDNFVFAVPILRKYQAKATFFIPTDFIGKDSILGFKGMSWDQLREICNDRLFEIGSHGQSHRKFSSLTAEGAREEITASKDILEKNLNKKIDSFAFPYGDFNREQQQEAKLAGYKTLFSVIRRRLRFPVNLKEIPRFGVDEFTSAFFKDFFNNGYEIYWRIYESLKPVISRV